MSSVRIRYVSTNLFGLLEARALPRQIGMGCGYQIPTTLLPTPSINDGTVKLPGLGSRRGWFESSSVHEFYGGVAQLVEHFVRTEEVMDSNSIAFH